MPLTTESSKDEIYISMFGYATWKEDCAEHLKNHPGAAMFAQQLLSDGQEQLLAHQWDAARQTMNKAKYVIREYLTSKPTKEETEVIERVAHNATEADGRKLLWLLDPRR